MLSAFAVWLGKTGNFTEALAAADRMLEGSPGNFDGQLLKGQALMILNRDAEAAGMLNQLRKDHPERANDKDVLDLETKLKAKH
jgi:predicted Zn-dependent protease